MNQAIYVSATPGPFEREHSAQLIEQVIRPLLYYFAAIFLVLLLVTYVPALSMWLPGLLGYV